MLDLSKQNEIISKYFRIINEQVIFKGVLGRVFIRDNYFDKGIASFVDTDIQTMGIFTFKIYDDIEAPLVDGDDKCIHEIHFKLPVTICLSPNYVKSINIVEKDAVQSFDDTFEDSEDEDDGPKKDNKTKYRVLEFYENAVFVKTTNIIQHIKNLKTFTSMLTGGQVPKEIGYDGASQAWLNCSQINGFGSMKSNSSLLELIVSNIYRNPYDLSEPFRLYLAKHPSADMSLAKPVRVQDIAKHVSAFGSLISGDPTRGLSTSIVRNKKNIKDIESPVEEQIK